MNSDLRKIKYCSRGIILDDSSEILCVQRAADAKHNAGLWEFPGGQNQLIEDAHTSRWVLEPPAVTAVREIHEEAGIRTIVSNRTAYEHSRPLTDLPITLKTVFVLGRAVTHNLRPDPVEVAAVGWFSLAEIGELDFTPESKAALAVL